MEFIRITVLGLFVNFFFMFGNSKLSVGKSMMMAVMFVWTSDMVISDIVLGIAQLQVIVYRYTFKYVYTDVIAQTSYFSNYYRIG